MGGEVTGTIDEKIRHATTKLADIHFPASMDAKKRIIKLGEEKKRVFMVGCPRIDLVRKVLKEKINYKYLNKFIDNYGVGNTFDIKKGFCLVSYHPVTTEYSFFDFNIKNILNILSKLNLNSIILWPNSDAGADKISADIRKFREKNKNLKNFKFIINLPVEIYIYLMNLTQCLIGNSSSGIREGSYIGTPVVDIGNRQKDREKGNNVINVKSNDIQALEKAIKFQINKKRYNSLNIYGDGHASNKIIKVLKNINLKSHKRITY
jgi:UDP-hydrolysing UDP-N-acetyl-D-glucosamine 2-epimerase